MDKKINLADLERENKQLRRQLAELDEMPKNKRAGEGASRLKDIQDIPTIVANKIRSVPPTRQDDRYYLDLYLLQKERERLVKETASIKRRRLQVGMKVSNVDKEMAEKEEKALADMTILSTEHHEKPGEKKTTGRNQKAPKRYEYKEGEWNKFTLEY